MELKPITNLLVRPSVVLESCNYNLIERIGGGRFSDVYKCLNRETDLIVAIKIINILEEEQNEGVPSSIIREISVLKDLEHANIVRLLDVLNKDNDVFLVFEYVDLDLDKFIKNQMIPKDALLVKVGSLRYRAPEILFGSTKYSTSLDIWSVGCIFAEMVIGRPLFTARHELLAFNEIFSLLGTPTEETWPGITSLCDFIDYFDPPTKPKDLEFEFPTLEPAGVDLLSKMLCGYPKSRISAEDALKHEFFNGLEKVQ